MKIAIIEDDARDARLLEQWLQAAGHTTHRVAMANTLMCEAHCDLFDMLILGATAGEAIGAAVASALRTTQVYAQAPVICLLGNATERDIVAALKAGADDCIVKPARQFELLARVEALARRARQTHRATQPGEGLDLGTLRVDFDNRVIYRKGASVTLTPKTYNLAVFLLTHAGRLLSRTCLMENVWGHAKSTDTRTLDTHISRLRTVLGLTPQHGWRLQSVYQHGYRLDRLEAIAPGREGAVIDGAQALEV